jgi:hypothetical protein
MLNNQLFICMADVSNHNDFEYVLVNVENKNNKAFSRYPNWTNQGWVEEMKPFVYIKNTAVHPDGTKFASFYAFFKKWRIYDYYGNLQMNISANIEPYQPNIVQDVNDRMVYYYGYPYTTKEYIYVLCKNSLYADHKKDFTELQVWNWEGVPKAIFQLDKKIDLFTISEKEKKIYALNKDEGNEDKIYVYSLLDIP